MSQDQSMSFDDNANLGGSTLRLSAPPPSSQQPQEPFPLRILTTIKIEDGYSRPLPPPLNPTDVKKQAAKLNGWTMLDEEGDILISAAPNKRTSASLQDDESTKDNGFDQHTFDGSVLRPEAASTSYIREGSETDNHHSKKRRIFNTNQREALMRSVATSHILSSPPISLSAFHHLGSDLPPGSSMELTKPPDATRRVPTVFGNETPTSTEDLGEDDVVFSVGEMEKASTLSTTSSEEDLVKYHARLHHKSIPAVQTHSDAAKDKKSKRWSLTGEAFDSILARKEKDEQESVKRSQMLRERKRGRALSEMPDDLMVDSLSDRIVGRIEHDSANSDSGSEFTHNLPDFHRNGYEMQSPQFSIQSDAQPSRKPHVNGDFEDTFLSEKDDDADLERLLDIAEDHDRSQTGAETRHHRNDRGKRPVHDRPRAHYRPNPFSRAAAERVRTQDRHLDKPSSPTDSALSSWNLADGEARLRHFTQMKVQTKPKAEYLEPECNSTHGERFYLRRPLNLFPREEPNANYFGSSSPSDEPEMSTLSTPIPRWKQNPSTTQFQAIKKQQMAQNIALASPSKALSSKIRIAAVERVSEGPLGALNDVDYEDYTAVAKEHERLKDQQRDLNAITETFHEIARLQSIDGELDAGEEKELQETRKYVTSVVDQQLPGRSRRARMRSIRDNVKRRIDRAVAEGLNPKEHEIESVYTDLIGESRSIKITEALENLVELLDDLQTLRSTLRDRNKEKNRPPRKKVSTTKKVVKQIEKRVRLAAEVEDENGYVRSDLADGTVIDLDGPPRSKPRPKKLTKEERNIRALQNTLKRFEKGQAGSDGEQSEDEADTSDRINGSAFMSSHLLPDETQQESLQLDQDIDEINRLEDERQRQEAQAAPCATTDHAAPRLQISQLYDPELLVKMQEKTLKMGRVVMTGETENGEEIDFADWTDTETLEDSDSDYSETDIAGTTQVYTYTVKGQFMGLDQYGNGQEYSFNTFHNFNKASEQVRNIISAVVITFKGNNGPRYVLNTQEDDGVFEQIVTIGKTENVQARVWTHRETIEIDLAKQAVSKARKRRLVDTTHVYQVSWEKTTTTTVTHTEQSTAPTSNDINASIDESADLFGPEPPAAPEVTVMIETCPAPVLHRDLAAANRLAKEDFMTWYSQHFPEKERRRSYLTAKGVLGYEYSGMLAVVNQAKERELERLGELGRFDCEEEVDVMQVGEAEGAGVEAGAGIGLEMTKRKEVKEKMRVFVCERSLLGPTN